jgi:sugar lactone lactonase YvrE
MKKAPCLASFLCFVILAVLHFAQFTAPARADLWGISVDAYSGAPPETQANYNKVFRFDNEGNKLSGDIPSHSAGLDYPSGIAVGPDGNIYVSSVNTGSIYHYSGQTGAPLSSPIAGPDGLFAFLGDAAPGQLAFGPEGNLYVSEFFGTNVRVYDAHPGINFGMPLSHAATGLTSAGGLAFASNGDLLVGDGFAMAEGQVAQIVRVHNGVQSTWGATGLGSFYAPVAMLTQANGDVLVVDLLANYIARVDDNGIPSQIPFAIVPPAIPEPPWPVGANIPSNSPSGLAFDPDGNLILSVLGFTGPPGNNSGALIRYDLSGNIIDPDNDMTPNEPIVSEIEPIGGIAWTPSLKTLAGDYDGDNSVGLDDYAKWRADFGKFVAPGNGADGNVNGIIDAADFVIWRKASSSGVGTGAVVPEPTTLLLILGGLTTAVTLRCRRKELLA